MRPVALLVAIAQCVLALRVFVRMARSAHGSRIERSDAPRSSRVSVIVPVLNEERRLAPCLEGLIAQGTEVTEILVVDGGSTDGTRALVAGFVERDARIRFIEAGIAPSGRNGKAHNLQVGYARATGDWLLTIDADVRPRDGLVAALLAQAARERVGALSAAARQRLADPIDAVIHPAMLTTLVYRFGIPGDATSDPRLVQANGQCMLLARSALELVDGFSRVQDSICEDVTLARMLALKGVRVGFYEAGDLIETQMYARWLETWSGWARSLPMRDRYAGWFGWIGLAEVTTVQALPVWLVVVGRRLFGKRHPLTMVNLGLAAARFGVLAGTRRAYVEPPASYWISPICDLPVALRLWWTATRRRHTWRGQEIVR